MKLNNTRFKFFMPGTICLQSGLCLIRCVLGLMLIYHGWEVFDASKMREYQTWEIFASPTGKWMVYAGKVAELLAGILFVLGLFTRIAALLTIATMCYIAFVIGNGIVWYSDQHPFVLALLALVFFFTGPGKFSCDSVFFTMPKQK